MNNRRTVYTILYISMVLVLFNSFIYAEASYLNNDKNDQSELRNYQIKLKNHIYPGQSEWINFEVILSEKKLDIETLSNSYKINHAHALRLQKNNVNISVMVEELYEFFLNDPPSKDRTTFSYDENGNQIEVLQENWENDSWNNNFLQQLTYGNMNYLTERISKVWENNLWINRDKSEFMYDSNFNLIQVTNYELTTKWELYSRQSYEYDENNNELEWKMEWRDGENWTPFIQTLSTYDEAGNLTSEIFKWGNAQGRGFENSSMSEFIYDSNNNVVEQRYKYWEAGEWIDEGIDMFTYNEDGSVERYSSSIYDTDSKALSTFNEYQNPVSIVTSVLNQDGTTWRETYRELYTYDENQNNTKYTSENNWSGTGWESVEIITRKFQQIADVSDEGVAIPQEYKLSQNYPNPFNPTTTIKFDIIEQTNVSIKVYDILGREVNVLINGIKAPGSYQVKFDANDLTSGIYFYTLKVENFTSTKKMLLVK